MTPGTIGLGTLGPRAELLEGSGPRTRDTDQRDEGSQVPGPWSLVPGPWSLVPVPGPGPWGRVSENGGQIWHEMGWEGWVQDHTEGIGKYFVDLGF